MKKVSQMFAIATFCFAVVSLCLVIFYPSNERVDSSHQIVLCVAAMVLTLIPSLLSRFFKITFPPFLRICFYAYITLGNLLGSIYDLYYIFPIWDKLLHLFSGIILTYVAFVFINTYTQKGHIKLNKPLTILAALLFSLSLGVLWEFFEYITDLILRANLQRYLLKDKTPLVGQAALHDTMQDLLWATAGSILTCIVYVLIEKRKATIIKNQQP